MVKKFDGGVRSDIARLVGARLITSVEGERGAKFAEAFIKQWTGGDKITTRELYSKEFEYKPSGKIWFATNYKPVISGVDPAIWSRIWLIPFEVYIKAEDRDPEIVSKLLGERSGIFNWCITGLRKFYAQGKHLEPIKKITDAVELYKDENDVLGDFFKSKCQLDPHAVVSRLELYTEYKTWCEQNGEEVMSATKFARKVQDRGVTKAPNSGSVRRWKGIMLAGQSIFRGEVEA
jgi:putative DNA primase/helicase